MAKEAALSEPLSLQVELEEERETGRWIADGCAAAHRLERKAHQSPQGRRLPCRARPSRLAAVRLVVHPGVEIGPPMLARTARMTGLTPEDL
jgi:hypothetical protein